MRIRTRNLILLLVSYLFIPNTKYLLYLYKIKQSHFKYPRARNKTDRNLTLFRKIFPPTFPFLAWQIKKKSPPTRLFQTPVIFGTLEHYIHLHNSKHKDIDSLVMIRESLTWWLLFFYALWWQHRSCDFKII